MHKLVIFYIKEMWAYLQIENPKETGMFSVFLN